MANPLHYENGKCPGCAAAIPNDDMGECKKCGHVFTVGSCHQCGKRFDLDEHGDPFHLKSDGDHDDVADADHFPYSEEDLET